MGVNFAQDWPVFILLGAVVVFFLYVVISGRKNSQKPDKSG